MKIAIIGKGKVGQATAQSLNCNVVYHDPAKLYILPNLIGCDAAIVCVDTLRNGPNDHSDLINALTFLNEKNFTGLVAIRCTVSPEFLEVIETQFSSLRIVMFPEFMRQTDDLKMDTPWVVVLGGLYEDTHQMRNLLIDTGYCTDVSKYHMVSAIESIIIKLCQNAGLATKVIFYNMVNEICEKYGAVYDNVRYGVGADERVGLQYSVVPSPDDGRKGFQGHCLPKDVNCLASVETGHGFFKKILEINKMLGR